MKGGVCFKFVGIYGHHQNGRIERSHRFLNDQLKCFKNASGSLKSWSKEINNISFKHNYLEINKLGYSPIQMILGIKGLIGKDEVQNKYITQKDLIWKKVFDFDNREKKLAEKFLVGDVVYILLEEKKKSKYENNEGPYIVVEETGDNFFVRRRGELL